MPNTPSFSALLVTIAAVSYSLIAKNRAAGNPSAEIGSFDAPNSTAIVQSRAILTKRMSSRHENRASKNV
jgi:hypothetical protein